VIVDSSVIVAILRSEPEIERFTRALEAEPICRISAPSLVELTLALDKVDARVGLERIDQFINLAELEIMPFSAQHARIAQAAHYRYGRNSGSNAKLNFGDCLTYALAIETDEPLLFKGGDFNHTDVRIDERSVITGKQRS
jgi:ribonuclease VapC